jgi:hypothetical protein
VVVGALGDLGVPATICIKLKVLVPFTLIDAISNLYNVPALIPVVAIKLVPPV